MSAIRAGSERSGAWPWPGTSMAFIGLTKPNERADVIAYLNSLADNPQPLPKPQ